MDWDDLKYVLEIARRGGVTAAARRLGVNHATVSRRVGALERKTGVRLFDRLPAGYTPTPAGLEAVRAAEIMETAVLSLDGTLARRDIRTEGVVTVTAPLMFLASVPFLRMVADLKQAYPGIVLRLIASIDLLNLHQREADLAIRSSEQPDDSLFGLKLTPIRSAAYAAPSYLASQSRAIRQDTMEWIGHIPPDETENRPTEFYRDKIVALSANDKLVAAAAAKAGLGIANLPCYFGDHEPGLRRVSTLPTRAYSDFWLLTLPDLAKVARIRAVMQVFASSAKRLRAVFEGSAADNPS